MYSKASIKEHPIHPMLVGLPITFYILTFVGLCAYNFTDAGLFIYNLAYFCNMGAIITAVIAAIPGFIDLFAGVPNGTAAKKDGLIHMSFNLLTLGLYVASGVLLFGYWTQPPTSLNVPIVLTGLGCASLVMAGYYGWRMVGIHKVGVSMTEEQEMVQRKYEESYGKSRPSMYH